MNDKFTQLLESIAKRPAMYVGITSLPAVGHFLAGYCQALSENSNIGNPMFGWIHWIELKFLIRHPGWHWTRILLHSYGSDKAAIAALPSLYKEFQLARQNGIEQIEQQLHDKLLQTYGTDCYQPEITDTTR